MIYRLENKEYLWLLLIIPLMVAGWWGINWLLKRRMNKLGSRAIISNLIPAFSYLYSSFKYSLLVISALLIVIALANPQTGEESISSRSVGFQINMVVDVSNSMLAEDIKPSRMEAVRQVLYKMMTALNGNRIGITVFAGEAFNQIPPTSDENILEAVVSTLSPELIPTQGSDLSKAIELAVQNFNFNEKDKKFMIIFTDGESHEKEFLNAVKEAASKGIIIYSIGVGSVKGANIPLTLPNGKKVLLKDPHGKVVVSRLNEAALLTLAEEGKGIYSKIEDESGIKSIQSNINNLSKRIVTEKIYSEYSSYFPYFIIPALFLILLEFFIPQYKIIRKD